jgi:hypothetical protein
MLDSIGKVLVRNSFYNPIFVIGTGRSGTSVLTQALGKHAGVYSSEDESPLIPYIGYLPFPFEFKDNSRYHRESLNVQLEYLYEQFRRICYESAMGENYGIRMQMDNLTRFNIKFLAKERWCAKTFPNQQEHAGLRKLYPNARFIYIVRNGCDVINSRMKFRGFRHLEFRDHCEVWAKAQQKYHYLLNAEQSIMVRHEDLLNQPEEIFQKLHSFIGIAHDPSPAEFVKSTMIHPLDERTKTNVDVSKAFSQRPPAYGNWSDEQKITFKLICGNAMEALGYSLQF